MLGASSSRRSKSRGERGGVGGVVFVEGTTITLLLLLLVVVVRGHFSIYPYIREVIYISIYLSKELFI